MKVCPRCKFYNQDKNKRCLRCGWALEPSRNLPELKPESDKKMAFNRFFHNVARFIRNTFRSIQGFLGSEIPTYIPHRFPFLAAGLSLFFGLGQVYNKQYKKAVFFFIGYLICYIIAIATITQPYSNIILFLFLAYALYTYNDGLVTALKINGQQWTWRYSLAAFSALFFVVGLGTVLGQFFLFAIFKLIWITQPTLEPAIYEGDIVYVDCMAYKFRGPRVGEVVFYTPEAFQIEVPGGMLGSDKYHVHEKRTFERIMGLPGDVIERKKGKFYRNGKPMPPWCEPLLPHNVFNDMHFEVPDDHYLAIFSHSPEEMSWGPSFGGRTPPLNSPGLILIDWDDACYVEKSQIFGRAIFVMNPPTHRRFLTPPM